jgi:hypothetical protein
MIHAKTVPQSSIAGKNLQKILQPLSEGQEDTSDAVIITVVPL